MLQDISKLKDRQYRALTGMDKAQFEELAAFFDTCQQQMQARHYAQYGEFYYRKPSPGGGPVFKTAQEKLFLVLFYMKNYPVFDVLGFVFGCSGKTAHENFYKFLPVLEYALSCLKVLPKRKFDSPDELVEFLNGHEDILIDATERLHHRKQDKQEQKKYYNGKKKAHTVKNTVISKPDKTVLFAGGTQLGAVHDYTLLKSEFDTGLDWFAQLKVWIDLGYLGFAKDYSVKLLNIPFKKPRKSKKNPDPKLSPEQKAHNREVSKVRVAVENAIGGIKRYNILVHRFRNKCEILRDKAFFLAAGIWNWTKGVAFLNP